jgi:hypothetical protein
MNYLAHILSLASRADITVRETARNDMQCKAWKRARIVQIMPVRDYRAYILALHELFHIIIPTPIKTLDKEMVAWGGAKNAAMIWTKEANQIVMECLKSYIDYYKGDKRIKVSRDFRLFIKSLI